MFRVFKVKFWRGGCICSVEVTADNIQEARVWFELNVGNDDIISIEEMKDGNC